MELPVYVCHKEVRALKIGVIENTSNGLMITPEDSRFVPFEADTVNRPIPEVGWYVVLYDNGYTSFSPAKAFEDGYTLKASV